LKYLLVIYGKKNLDIQSLHPRVIVSPTSNIIIYDSKKNPYQQIIFKKIFYQRSKDLNYMY